jgi:hypothetical protein
MKDANAAIRRHAAAGPEAQVAELVALGHAESRARELLRPDFCGRVGFPAYALQNNNANNRRMRERLEAVAKAQATPETVREGTAARLEDCPAENRARLFFPAKPARAIRDRLSAHGFRWAPSLMCWQAYRNAPALHLAAEVAGIGTAEVAAE